MSLQHLTVAQLRILLAHQPADALVTLTDVDGYNCKVTLYAGDVHIVIQEKVDENNNGLFEE